MDVIPFDPSVSADQQFRIQLGDEMVTLRLVYNDRSNFWFITVTNSNGDALDSIKVVPNWPLLNQYVSAKPIEGDLFVFPVVSTTQEPIGYEGLGDAWMLCWASSDEVNEWRSNNGLG
ncbi:MAG: hypothetical protein WCQ59_06335 [Candidatus Cloacimonadaceae bacterium]